MKCDGRKLDQPEARFFVQMHSVAAQPARFEPLAQLFDLAEQILRAQRLKSKGSAQQEAVNPPQSSLHPPLKRPDTVQFPEVAALTRSSVQRDLMHHNFCMPDKILFVCPF